MIDWREHQELFEAAVAYAETALSGTRTADGERLGDGWDDITYSPLVSHAIALLGAEYRDAVREGRGMEPEEVRWVMQVVLNAASFKKENEPPTYDPESSEHPADPDLRIWRYVRKAPGRPSEPAYSDAGIAFTVGEIAGRFDLDVFPNKSLAPNSSRRPTAIEVLVAAQGVDRRNGNPRSIDGVEHALNRVRTKLEAKPGGLGEYEEIVPPKDEDRKPKKAERLGQFENNAFGAGVRTGMKLGPRSPKKKN